jgi:hypothetical protein
MTATQSQVEAVTFLFELAFGFQPHTISCDENSIVAVSSDEMSFADIDRKTGCVGIADVEQGCWSFASVADAYACIEGI